MAQSLMEFCFFSLLWFFVFFFFWSFLFFLGPSRGMWRFPGQGAYQSYSHSHSYARSELPLRSTPQLTSTPDPSPTVRSQGSNPQPQGSSSDSLTAAPRQELCGVLFLKQLVFLFTDDRRWLMKNFSPLCSVMMLEHLKTSTVNFITSHPGLSYVFVQEVEPVFIQKFC